MEVSYKVFSRRDGVFVGNPQLKSLMKASTYNKRAEDPILKLCPKMIQQQPKKLSQDGLKMPSSWSPILLLNVPSNLVS